MSYDSAFGQMMNNVFGGFDIAIFSFFGSIQNDVFTFLAKFFTCLGEPFFVVMLCLVCLFLCLFKKSRKIAVMLLFTVFFYIVINDLIFKQCFLRLRPYNTLQWDSQFFNWYMNVGGIADSPYCFPSGHSCCSFALCVVLYLWMKNDKNYKRTGFIFIIPALVASSRVYLMVHFPTDVITGSIEGVLIGCIVWYGAKLVLKIGKKLPETIRDWNYFDLQMVLEKKMGREIDFNKIVKILLLVLFCFLVSTFIKMNGDIEDAKRCDHKGPDYVCMNEGKIKVWDDSIGDYRYHCEIHK